VTTTTEKALPAREILLVGPYGVLGTGVLDAAAANPAWRITTAARRPPPTYRASTALRHMHVDLLDRKGTMQVFSDLSTVTELVFAAYVEKPTMRLRHASLRRSTITSRKKFWRTGARRTERAGQSSVLTS